MFLRNTMDEQSQSDVQEHLRDSQSGATSNVEQRIAFPYTGPPGAGPGLLGSKPGAYKLDHLIALEHHAASLKSALTIAANLRNAKNKELDVEMVYDSICDIESELKRKNCLSSQK